MKIRTGFVSNSSSSSFLVIYKSAEDFNRFSTFEHTKDLLEDMSKSGRKDVLNFVKHLVLASLGDRFYDFIYPWRDPRSYSKSFDDLQVLVELSKVSDSEYLDLYHKINRSGWDVYEEQADELKGCEHYDKPWYKEYKKFWEDLRPHVEDVASRLAADIADSLTAQGLTASHVCYEDHDDYGSYMEHYFMPFLTFDPDEKITVITINRH